MPFLTPETVVPVPPLFPFLSNFAVQSIRLYHLYNILRNMKEWNNALAVFAALFRTSRRFNLMAGIILTLLVFFYAVGW